MTTCNGASVNRMARCGKTKTSEFRKEQERNPPTCACSEYLHRINAYVCFIYLKLYAARGNIGP